MIPHARSTGIQNLVLYGWHTPATDNKKREVSNKEHITWYAIRGIYLDGAATMENGLGWQ